MMVESRLQYKYGLETLKEAGCDVDGLEFDPNLVTRGLIVDRELGNIIKADRFGWVREIHLVFCRRNCCGLAADAHRM